MEANTTKEIIRKKNLKDAYYLQEPRKQLFYKYMIYLANIAGVAELQWWDYTPTKSIGKFMSGCTIFVRIACPYTLITEIIYFYRHYSTMAYNVKKIMFAFLPITFYVSQCLISSNRPTFKRVMLDLMHNIHIYNYKTEKDFLKTKYIEVEKKTRRASYFLTGFLMVDFLAWSVNCAITSILNRDLVENGTIAFETINYIMLPLNYEYNFRHWIPTHILNVFVLFMGCLMIVGHICPNYVLVYQLIGHIKILKHNIETDFIDDLSQQQVREKLVNNVKHHSFILKIFRDIQDAVGLNVTSFYLYNLLADSMLLYLVMTGDIRTFPVYGLMITVYMGGLIIISFILEEVKIQSDDLSDLVYGLRWEDWSVTNQKTVLLLLVRAQPQMEFTAAFGFKAGVQPMISIVKATFSYYLMLKRTMST